MLTWIDLDSVRERFCSSQIISPHTFSIPIWIGHYSPNPKRFLRIIAIIDHPISRSQAHRLLIASLGGLTKALRHSRPRSFVATASMESEQADKVVVLC